MRRGKKRERRGKQGGWGLLGSGCCPAAPVSSTWTCFPPEAAVERGTTQQMAGSSWARRLTEELQCLGLAHAPREHQKSPSNPEVEAQSHPSIPAPLLCSNYPLRHLILPPNSPLKFALPEHLRCPSQQFLLRPHPFPALSPIHPTLPCL